MIYIQLIGLVALLLDVASVQLKYRRHILGVQILASTTWVTHFMLLGATAGAVMNMVGVVRSLGYYRFHDRPRWLLWLVIMLSVLMTILFWQGVVGLLPMMAMVIAAIAFWQRNEQRIRLLLMVCAPLWLTYNVIFGSYAGIASDMVAFTSAAVALYRYRQQGFQASPAHARVTS